ncbi:MAG: hypothetical protein RL596_372 [Bacteroidota bacterium]
MQPGKFLLLDGKLLENDAPVLSANNRSFRYGDGFFETIRWEGDTALLWHYHVERFFDSLRKLSFEVPTHWNDAFLRDAIARIVKKNGHDVAARVRCTVFRGEGGLYDANNNQPHLLIQTWPLQNTGFTLNANGLDICIYRNSVKAADNFSALKTNSALPYVLAATYAKKHKCNDSILLNQWNRVTDTSIANIFYIDKKNIIYTPSLSEGCVSGVMRKYIIEKLEKIGLTLIEQPVSTADLASASGVFLTNAVRGIQWVKSLDTAFYSINFVAEITKKIFLEKDNSK